MNKSHLIDAIAGKADISKAAAGRALDAFTDTITETLAAGSKVSLPGFGSFEVKARGERQGRNPKTGEALTIAAAKAPAFKAGKTLKASVNA